MPIAPSMRRSAIMPSLIGVFSAPIAKQDAVRHEGYRRLVAAMPCKICGIQRHSQAAHPNANKGKGIKADDRGCFPLCVDRVGVKGCHAKFDQYEIAGRILQQPMEAAWGADTRRQISAQGLWPKDLPPMDDAA
jgi:hypothetical protein